MMIDEVKYFHGNLKDKDFQDILLDELNPRETKRLFAVITELVAYGHTNLQLICTFKKYEKHISVDDLDIPERNNGWDLYEPRRIGHYWLSGGPSEN